MPLLGHTTDFLRRNEYITEDVDHAVSGNTILNSYSREGIDLDDDEAAITGDVDAECFVLQKGWQIDLRGVNIR